MLMGSQSVIDTRDNDRSFLNKPWNFMQIYAAAARRILLPGVDISTNPGPCKDGTRVRVVNRHKNYLKEFATAINTDPKT